MQRQKVKQARYASERKRQAAAAVATPPPAAAPAPAPAGIEMTACVCLAVAVVVVVVVGRCRSAWRVTCVSGYACVWVCLGVCVCVCVCVCVFMQAAAQPTAWRQQPEPRRLRVPFLRGTCTCPRTQQVPHAVVLTVLLCVLRHLRNASPTASITRSSRMEGVMPLLRLQPTVRHHRSTHRPAVDQGTLLSTVDSTAATRSMAARPDTRLMREHLCTAPTRYVVLPDSYRWWLGCGCVAMAVAVAVWLWANVVWPSSPHG